MLSVAKSGCELIQSLRFYTWPRCIRIVGLTRRYYVVDHAVEM